MSDMSAAQQEPRDIPRGFWTVLPSSLLFGFFKEVGVGLGTTMFSEDMG